MLDTIPHGKTREDGALFKSNPTDYLTYRQSGWDMLGTMPHRKMGHRGRRTREGEGSGGEGGRGLPGPDGLPALEGRQCLRSAVEARPAQSSVQQTVGSEFACTAGSRRGGGGEREAWGDPRAPPRLRHCCGERIMPSLAVDGGHKK
ncbi:unnamed protein product [Prorocentrum cordatum]|nr:unnamed protein product [Polarella glacialis]